MTYLNVSLKFRVENENKQHVLITFILKLWVSLNLILGFFFY